MLQLGSVESIIMEANNRTEIIGHSVLERRGAGGHEGTTRTDRNERGERGKRAEGAKAEEETQGATRTGGEEREERGKGHERDERNH